MQAKYTKDANSETSLDLSPDAYLLETFTGSYDLHLEDFNRITELLAPFKTKLLENKKYTAECCLALKALSSGRLVVNGREIQLSYDIEVGHGGFKKIYDIGNGEVLALRNDNDGFSNSTLQQWQEATVYEESISRKLHKLGLEAQDYQRVEVTINNHTIPALMMTHFKELESKGLQIRGSNKKEQFGTTLLFGNMENIKSEAYIRALLKNVIQDIITLIANKIDLCLDAFDILVIKNTQNTPHYDKNTYGTVIDRKQELHIYFIDFFEKQKLQQRGRILISMDKKNQKHMEELIRVATCYLDAAFNSLLCGITEYENELLNTESATALQTFREMYNGIYDSLIVEICSHVISDLKAKKVAQQFNTRTKIVRSLSTDSFFSNQKDNDNKKEFNYNDPQNLDHTKVKI